MSLIETKADYRSGKLAKADYIQKMHEKHRVLFEFPELMKSTDISKIEITDDEVIMTARRSGVRFVCDSKDQRIAPIEILNFDSYEESDAALLTQLIEPGQTVLDVGANFGWYSMSLAKAIPDLKIHAFEPIPGTFAFLKRNIELNGFTNIKIHNFGFSTQTEKKTFYFYPEGSGNASLANLSERSAIQEVVCQIRRLDDVIAQNGFVVDFIKCDVEGAELFVFQGGLQTLHQQKPLVFTEMLRKWAARFGYHPNQIIELLAQAGYRCFTAENNGLKEFTRMDEASIQTNFFFLHTERHADKIQRWGR